MRQRAGEVPEPQFRGEQSGFQCTLDQLAQEEDVASTRLDDGLEGSAIDRPSHRHFGQGTQVAIRQWPDLDPQEPLIPPLPHDGGGIALSHPGREDDEGPSVVDYALE